MTWFGTGWSNMRNALLLLLPLLACEQKQEVPAAERTPAPATRAALDTMLADEPEYSQVNLDSLRTVLDSLETELARAAADRQPYLLFELGRAKKRFIPELRSPHEAYAKAREGEYWYNEIGGNYLYQGTHFRQLIERFPDHHLADDAGYQLTMLPEGGECEGFITCYIARSLHDVQDFLVQFPNSPYAPRALERVMHAFETQLNDLDLTKKSADQMYDPNELPPIVARFDTATMKLPPALRAQASALVGRINARLAGK